MQGKLRARRGLKRAVEYRKLLTGGPPLSKAPHDTPHEALHKERSRLKGQGAVLSLPTPQGLRTSAWLRLPETKVKEPRTKGESQGGMAGAVGGPEPRTPYPKPHPLNNAHVPSHHTTLQQASMSPQTASAADKREQRGVSSASCCPKPSAAVKALGKERSGAPSALYPSKPSASGLKSIYTLENLKPTVSLQVDRPVQPNFKGM